MSATPQTLTAAFRRTVESCPDALAVRTLDGTVSLTWAQLAQRIDAVAAAMRRRGVRRGDTVALLLSNRPEFHIADLAAVRLGAVPFSVYATLPPEQMAYVLCDAQARIAVVECGFLETFRAARRSVPHLEHVIVVGDGAPDNGVTLAALEHEGREGLSSEAAFEPEPEDLVTLIYTSGTTGPPKGVQLTHRNVLALARALEQVVPFERGGRVVSWLPAAHIAERAAHHYLPVIFGLSVTTLPNPRDIVAALPRVRPTWFFAVPRIWEKIKAGLEARIMGLPDEQRRQVDEALSAAREKVRLEQAGQPVPPAIAAHVARADKALFAGWRAMLGLDEVRVVNVGAAPTPRDVLEFFHAIGLPLSEIWGLSETTGGATTAPPGKIRIGTVGLPLPGIEIRLAEDGEVLVRGDAVMAGYRNLPEKTREVLSPEGWLATGDIGAIDADGYLRIVDRKKEIIINAAGKNMSPANIESTLKGACALLGQAVVIGDGRPYNTALVVLDPDAAFAWAARHGLEPRSLEELAREPALVEAVRVGVEAANARLARVEQIRRFHIVPGEWMPGGDELTPTMKLKRRPILEKYAREIEALYAR